LLSADGYAANPFLDASNDKPVTAKFRGTERGDEISEDEIPLTARVVTARVAKMPWGAIYKIEFLDLKSRASRPRKIQPDYFVVTDDKIGLLNEENIPDAIKRISGRSSRNLSRQKFTVLPAAASITKTDRGKRQSELRAIRAFTKQPIRPSISKGRLEKRRWTA
jgi:hypothetical protein